MMWKNNKVLIVDDAPLIQKQLIDIFRDLGFQVCGCANNGLEALELIQNEKPDLVSIDIIMPQMHGVDLYRNIKALDEHLKCIFVTCLEGDEISKAFSEEIPSAICFPKPPNRETIRMGLTMIYSSQGEHPVAKNPSAEAHDGR